MKTIFLCSMLAFCTLLQYAQVNEEWVRTYEGNVSAAPFDMAVDDGGNVYITGATIGTQPLTGNDFTTIKYSSSGDFQWEATYNGTYNNFDEASAVTVDLSGNVYVTGHSPGVINNHLSGRDYATIKYDSGGNELWVQRYNGNPSLIYSTSDTPTDIVVDDIGNVYVTGASYSDGGLIQNCLTLKYDASGSQQWEARYEEAGLNSLGEALKVDALGNVYVSGYGTGLIGGLDYITVKYNSSGQELWAKRYNFGGSGINIPATLVIDDVGNVYVTGSSEGGSGYLTLKYNSTGDLIWAATYSEFSTIDRATDIAIDGSGNVYVTGQSMNSQFTTTEYATIKYNSAGVEQWVSRYAGLGGVMGSSGASAIALDDLGNVYVTGHSEGADFLGGDYYDYATIKYNNTGNEQWAIRFNGISSEGDKAIAIFVDDEEKIYITGESHDSGSQTFVTIKYAQSPSDVQEINSEVPNNYLLSQNYPNPFNPTTTIKFQIPQTGFISLKIYDILGNEITTLVNEELQSGSYEAIFNAEGFSSGIYFYKLQAGSFVETKKMILIR